MNASNSKSVAFRQMRSLINAMPQFCVTRVISAMQRVLECTRAYA